MTVRTLVVAALVSGVPALPYSAYGQRSVSSVVIFDVRQPEPTAIEIVQDPHNVAAYRIDRIGNDSVACKSIPKPPKPTRSNPVKPPYGLNNLMGLISCATPPKALPGESLPPTATLEQALSAVHWIDYIVATNSEKIDFRARSIGGDTIRIVVLQLATVYRNSDGRPMLILGQTPRLRIAEPSRESRIGSDMRTLARLVFAIGSRPGAVGAASTGIEANAKAKLEPWISVSDYALRVLRANLAIEARPGEPDNAVLASAVTPEEVQTFLGASANRGRANPLGASSADNDAALAAALVTGPAEHWYLSTDVPFTPQSKFTLNDKNELTAPENPSVFYVSLNFLIGDLLSENRSVRDNLLLKGMVTLSKNPFDSFGFGIGLRGKYLKKYGVDFDLISPFIAVTSTRETSTQSTAVSPRSVRRNSVRFGGSLNLDKALGWVGK